MRQAIDFLVLFGGFWGFINSRYLIPPAADKARCWILPSADKPRCLGGLAKINGFGGLFVGF